MTPLKVMPVAASLAVLLAGCTVRVDTEERISHEEKRFTVSGEADVHVSTFDGAVEVRSWDRDEVLVEIDKRAADEEALKSIQVRAEQQGNRIEVNVSRPSGRESFTGIGFHIATRASLNVTVPRKLTLHVRSGDGSIRAEGLEGRLELRTDDGSVRGSELKGDLDVDTRDGSIVLEDIDGSVRLETRDGGISASGRLASVKARTGDGSVTIRADRGSVMSSDWTMTTSDGSVAVYLPEDFSAELDAQTTDGRVRSEFDIQQPYDDERSERRRSALRGRIGSGGKLLRVRTGDGSVVIRNW